MKEVPVSRRPIPSPQKQFVQSLLGALVILVMALTLLGVAAHIAGVSLVKVVDGMAAEYRGDQNS